MPPSEIKKKNKTKNHHRICVNRNEAMLQFMYRIVNLGEMANFKHCSIQNRIKSTANVPENVRNIAAYCALIKLYLFHKRE